MTSFKSEAARIIDKFNGVQPLEIQNKIVGIYEILGCARRIRGTSTFQCKSKCVGVSKMRQEGHVNHQN